MTHSIVKTTLHVTQSSNIHQCQFLGDLKGMGGVDHGRTLHMFLSICFIIANSSPLMLLFPTPKIFYQSSPHNFNSYIPSFVSSHPLSSHPNDYLYLSHSLFFFLSYFYNTNYAAWHSNQNHFPKYYSLFFPLRGWTNCLSFSFFFSPYGAE